MAWPTTSTNSLRPTGQQANDLSKGSATSIRIDVEPLEPRRLFAAAGDLDPSFGSAGRRVLDLNPAVEIRGLDEAGGRIVVVGRLADAPTVDENPDDDVEPPPPLGVVTYTRLTARGRPDAKFQAKPGATAGLDQFDDATGVVIQADKRIVVAGKLRDGTPAVWRLAADGSLNLAFGTAGVCRLPFAAGTAPVLAPDGSVLVAGTVYDPDADIYATDVAAVRLTAGGVVDSSFGTAGVALAGADLGSARSIAVRPDGRVVVGGSTLNPNFDPRAFACEFSPTGQRNPAFSFDENLRDSTIVSGVAAVAVTPDGSTFLYVSGGSGRYINYVVKIGTDGSQTRFGDVSASFEVSAKALRTSPDGQKVTAIGSFSTANTYYDSSASPAVLRFDADGTPDHTFNGTGGALAEAADFGDVQADGKVVTVGTSYTYLPDTDTPLASHFVERRVVKSRATAGVAADGTLWVEGKAVGETIAVTATAAAGKRPAGYQVAVGRSTFKFPAAGVTAISVDGGGDDVIDVAVDGPGVEFTAPIEIPTARVTLRGGAGNDTLTGSPTGSNLFGGDGDDHLIGRAGKDFLYGGPGADLLDGGLGGDFMRGGDPDLLFNLSGGGVTGDTVTYADRTAGVSVTTYDSYNGYDSATLANDGEPGERDDVGDVGTVLGGAGDDVIKAARFADFGGSIKLPVHFLGGPGDDLLVGDDGPDYLDGGLGADRLYGQAGDDLLSGVDGVADYLDGGDGNDRGVTDPLDALFGVEQIA
jgi:uncharacterized delta-60 repeat protein